MFWPSVVLKRQELSLQENREDKVSLTSDLIWAGHTSGRAPDHASVHTTTRLPAYAHVTGQVPDSEHLTEPTTKEPTIEEVTLPLLVLSTGLHGIEGYVGAHLIDRYIRSFYNPSQIPYSTGPHDSFRLYDPSHTIDPSQKPSFKPPFDLVLIHGINPWGMLNRRKANARNVDLNRNFVIDWQDRETLYNPDYDALKNLLHPAPARSGKGYFYGQLLQALLRLHRAAPGRIERALTLGQFTDPEGPYYGGTVYEPETVWMMDVIKCLFSRYQYIVWLDLHTGYGPRGLMQVVRASRDPQTRERWQQHFSYPHVVETTGESFYAINGDMIEYMYAYRQANHPHLSLFAATLEFGTLGDALPALIRSLSTTVFENAAYHADRKTTQHEHRLLEMYAPVDARWLETTTQQFLLFMQRVHNRLQNACL
ncbi:MAG: hypothetical protein BSOLF_1836 [Candidatus Carbobacillus altaicus]|uniref:DUF2817 domain-containing protein n=1 Tax=Candidatus Carbonibacillus altaicus TaxID=2163959 RepID=A0A2R6Y3S3_9BACL|nr:MAG: hypothetical protein BSOLF_1836 [Candidatus Carbobacillus altaicus]